MPDGAVETKIRRPHAQHGGYWLTLFVITFTIIVISLKTSANRFGDFDTYVSYMSQLVHFPPQNWYVFEALSNFYLLLIYYVVLSVEQSIVVAHYLLGIIFVAFLVHSSPPGRTSWQSLLFISALVGPLLAFVTLRATPSYFLAAVAVRHALERRPRAWVYFVIASFFHASTFLTLAPFALLYFREKLPKALQFTHPARIFIISVVILGAASLVAPQASAVVQSLLESIPILSKYVAYTDQSSTIPQGGTGIGHFILLAFVTLFTMFYFLLADTDGRKLNGYILSSYVIYIILFAVVSPVAAARQTPFWMIPMITLYPWHRVGVRAATAPLFMAFCAALFAFQFSQVYQFRLIYQ